MLLSSFNPIYLEELDEPDMQDIAGKAGTSS